MIVAEIGLNHLGNKELLMKYVKKLCNSKIDAITIQLLTKKQLKQNKLEFCELKISEIEDFINFVKKKNKKVGLALGDFKKIKKIRNLRKIDFIKILSKDLNKIIEIKKTINFTKKNIYLSTGFIKKNSLINLLKKLSNYRKKIKLIYTNFKKNFQLSDLTNINDLNKSLHIDVAYGNHSKNTKFIFLSSFFNPESIFFYVKIKSPMNQNRNLPDDFHALDLNNINNFLKMIKLLSTKNEF